MGTEERTTADVDFLRALERGNDAPAAPLTYAAKNQPSALWWTLGLAMGAANSVRHRLQGYRTPRQFGTEDVQRNVQYAIHIAANFLAHADAEAKGLRVLELGPGPDLGTGAVLLALGAESYTAADRFPLAGSAPDSFYEALAERLDRPVDRARIQYKVTNFPAMADVEGPFDLIVSNAAAEHFDDVPATMRRLAQLLAPEGAMIHVVDGITHMRGVRERDPLNLLRYPDWLYRATAFPGIPNRLRASDFLDAAQGAGLTAMVRPFVMAPYDYVEKVRPGLARPFRNRPTEDLARLTFGLICTAPPA